MTILDIEDIEAAIYSVNQWYDVMDNKKDIEVIDVGDYVQVGNTQIEKTQIERELLKGAKKKKLTKKELETYCGSVLNEVLLYALMMYPLSRLSTEKIETYYKDVLIQIIKVIQTGHNDFHRIVDTLHEVLYKYMIKEKNIKLVLQGILHALELSGKWTKENVWIDGRKLIKDIEKEYQAWV